MKKFLIIFVLCLFFTPNISFADYNWKKIGSNTGGAVLHIDLSTIKKVGNNVYYFDLFDYVKPDSWGHLSSKTYKEVNCLDLSFRFLKDFYYLEPMENGKANLINHKADGKWHNNAKGSLGEYVRKFACNY